jgi:phosphate transport system permease protein
VNPAESGYRTAILGTIYLIGGVIALIVPWASVRRSTSRSTPTAPSWYNRLIELNIQNLAGVPSIVFGILGLAFIVRGPLSSASSPPQARSPSRCSCCPRSSSRLREAIRSVPTSIKDGSFALGATQWQTIRRQLLVHYGDFHAVRDVSMQIAKNEITAMSSSARRAAARRRCCGASTG